MVGTTPGKSAVCATRQGDARLDQNQLNQLPLPIQAQQVASASGLWVVAG